MIKETPNKNFVGLDEPAIEAITAGLFRFAKASQAVTILQRLSRKFTICDDQEPIVASAPPTLKLWIHSFSLTEAEREKGYVGHFARLVITKLDSGKITIIAEKIQTPLNEHPIKNAPKRHNPNTGHPLVRAAARGKTFENIEQLRNALLQMHEEFPETTIPGQDKLYLMLYSRTSKPPLRKMRLTIIPAESGGFKLALSEQSKRKTVKVVPTAPETPKAEEGKFASMVQLRRKGRKKIKSKKAE